MADQHVGTFKNYVGGQWLNSNSGNTYEITSPASKDTVLGCFQISGIEDVSQAVDAAHSALPSWSETPAPGRAHILYKALEVMERRSEELARTITIEEGKPLSDARGEVRRAMNIIEYAAGEGRRMFGYTTPRVTQSHGLYCQTAIGRSIPHYPMELSYRNTRMEIGSSSDLRQHSGL